MSTTFLKNLGFAALAGIVVVLVLELAPGPRKERFEKTFSSAVARYHRELGSLVPRDGAAIPDAHVRRKVLAIEVDEGKAQLSEVHTQLSRSLVANNLDEVKSVAWIAVTHTKVGLYVPSKDPKHYDTMGRRFVPAGSSASPALRCSMDVTLIDPTSKKPTAFARFEGPMPPESISGNTHWVACPRAEVAEWIGNLPAKR